MRYGRLLPVFCAALFFLAAALLRKLTGMDWPEPLPAMLFSAAPLAATLAMAATRSVPYSTRPLLAAGLALAGALFAAVKLFGNNPEVTTLLITPILLFSMVGVFPQRRGWCYTDRGLLTGSAAMAVLLLGAAALVG